MYTVMELKEFRKKIAADKRKYEKEFEDIIAAETFLFRYPYTKTALVAKMEALEELDKWVKDKIEGTIKSAMLMAEMEL